MRYSLYGLADWGKLWALMKGCNYLLKFSVSFIVNWSTRIKHVSTKVLFYTTFTFQWNRLQFYKLQTKIQLIHETLTYKILKSQKSEHFYLFVILKILLGYILFQHFSRNAIGINRTEIRIGHYEVHYNYVFQLSVK